MSYIGFAWLAGLTYAFGSVVGKFATKHHIPNPWLYNFVWFALTTLFTLPFAVAGGLGWPQDWPSMLWLSLANAVSGTMFMLAFYAVDLSVLSPLSNIRTPLTAIAGVILLGERIAPMQWVLIGIIMTAGIFVCLDERMHVKHVLNRNMLLALAWIGTSVWFNSMIKYASVRNGFWEVSFWSSAVATVMALLSLPLFAKDLQKTPLNKYSGLTLSTVLFTVGFLFSVRALGSNVGISMAIISLPLSMVFTMILSLVNPRLLETHTVKVYAVRLIAAGVMVAAALGLSR